METNEFHYTIEHMLDSFLVEAPPPKKLKRTITQPTPPEPIYRGTLDN